MPAEALNNVVPPSEPNVAEPGSAEVPSGRPLATPLPRLAAQASEHEHGDLAAKLSELQAWLSGDLLGVEQALLQTTGANLAQRAGWHILAAGGKRLRPLCTLLASRFGPRQDAAAHANSRNLAVAVELVHAATLLHDDVVDLADTRRGQATARALHGNEVSIFAGDWLLVEALRRIVATGHAPLVTEALNTVEALILAEVDQGERAKNLAEDTDGYYRVIDGKTASLFRFALRAGAVAGGCSPETTAALVQFGSELGMAFQLVDDVLDFEGTPTATGKSLLADLKEGKITLPLALTLRQHPELRPAVAAVRGATLAGQEPEAEAVAAIVTAVRQSGALATARAVAAARLQQAQDALNQLPESAQREALRAIADALATRRA